MFFSVSGAGFFKLGAGSGSKNYIRSRSQIRKKPFRIRKQNAYIKVPVITFFDFFFSRKNSLKSSYCPKNRPKTLQDRDTKVKFILIPKNTRKNICRIRKGIRTPNHRKSRIRKNHPGSTTLVIILVCTSV
jgi:hypothetical protein